MNRFERKFRAFIIREHRIVDVESISWGVAQGNDCTIMVNNPAFELDKMLLSPTAYKVEPFFAYTNVGNLVDFILLQYTGLHSNNNPESTPIFEGDLLRSLGTDVRVVEWEPKRACFIMRNIEVPSDVIVLNAGFIEHRHVDGNIHLMTKNGTDVNNQNADQV